MVWQKNNICVKKYGYPLMRSSAIMCQKKDTLNNKMISILGCRFAAKAFKGILNKSRDNTNIMLSNVILGTQREYTLFTWI